MVRSCSNLRYTACPINAFNINVWYHICYEFQLEHHLKTLFWLCNCQITSESRFWVTFFSTPLVLWALNQSPPQHPLWNHYTANDLSMLPLLKAVSLLYSLWNILAEVVWNDSFFGLAKSWIFADFSQFCWIIQIKQLTTKCQCLWLRDLVSIKLCWLPPF